MPSLSSLLPASSAAACCRFLSSFGSSPLPLLPPPPSPCRNSHLLVLSFVPHHHVCSGRKLYTFARLLHSAVASAAASASASAAVESLPLKLAEIVKLFQLVPDPRAKYEQLLHYGKKLNPLRKEFQTTENKVQGCVSQVWVRATMDDQERVYFDAESDSLLTKGLAALLVEGLSGSSAADILKISPDFIQMLGLNQSLTPSRSNGFLNMLKLMQKKTLELVMESDGVRLSDNSAVSGESPDVGKAEEKVIGSTRLPDGDIAGARSETMTRQQIIRQKLETAMDPLVLEVEDVSYQHAGHAGVQRGASETHFNLKIVSPKFEGKSLVKRHRLVYELLQEELQSGLHALSIVAKTPAEADKI